MSRYLTILLSFLLYLCIKGELNLEEGSPCVTDGIDGICTIILKCPIPFNTYTYRNAGFSTEKYKFPELPEICSYRNKYPVVCCTDCELWNDTRYKDATVNPYGEIIPKTDSIAQNQCADYLQNLPYPCRGTANVKFESIWNEDKKCHELFKALASPVGGRNAERWEFPHMALLGFGEDVDSSEWLCGGTIISERFILTAAHCTYTESLDSVKFASLGLLKRTDPKEYWNIYKIKRIVVHPEYKPPSKYNDIALLETETEINFNTNLLPACLDTNKKNKGIAEASGWGRLGHRKPLADNLQVVELNEYNQITCSDIYQPHRHLIFGYDHEKQMCYGSTNAIIDTCEGDSGGPLQIHIFKCQYTVVGVTSFGKACGMLGSPGVYTRVSHYVPWIESVVWPTLRRH